MIGRSILFSEMRPDPSWEDRFNTWYHEDHIPVRMVLEGFEGAQRYRSKSDENYLVVYDMTSMEALKTPGYEKLKADPSDETKWMLKNVSNFTRYLGTEIGRHGDVEGAIEAPLVFTAMFNVPDEEKADFDAWMTDDHLPILMENKDWMAVRRFELSVAEPTPFNRLAIHYLAGDEVLSSPERERARGTDWRNRLAERQWFQGGQYKGFNRYGTRYLAL
jgi:hypothetical protein|tara:strand:+ start:20220 stop:20876 length:657 start_codon:yes stop_codon:yes gene_type:complete